MVAQVGNIREFLEAQEAIAWCDEVNAEGEKKLIKWLQLQPEDDPDVYIGLHPEDSTLIGPSIKIGQRYRIVYSSPVRLPFKDAEGPAVFHIAEIEGTLITPFLMSDVHCIICMPDDYTVRETMSAERSFFRLFVGDELKLPENGSSQD